MAKKKQHTVSVYVRLPEDTYDALVRAAFHKGYPHTKTSIASEVLVKHFAKASAQ